MLRKALRILVGLPVQPATQQAQAVDPILTHSHRQQAKERELIRRESQIGGTLFGAVPAGHHREFFCLDAKTWVWFEEWYNSATQLKEQMNVHYEFQPRGVLKTVNGVPHGYVEGQELTNLLAAMKTYHDRVLTETYGYARATA